MINFKLIAWKMEEYKIKDLIIIIGTRKDSKEKTGVKVTVTQSTWESDSSGYGGENVDYNVTHDQEKVILNAAYNKERRQALEKLARIGGPKVILALVNNIVKRSWETSGELRENYQVKESRVRIVIDDLTFEDEIEARGREIVQDLISKLTNEEVKSLFEGKTDEIARFCIALNSNYHSSYLEILRRLATISPDGIIELFCKLNIGYRSDFSKNRRADLENHEEPIYSLINADVRSRAKLSSLTMLHYQVKNQPLKETIFKEISQRMTVEDAVEIINNVKNIDREVLIIVFKFIFENYGSKAIDSLNFVSFIGCLDRFIQELMKEKNPDLLVRKEYPKLSYRMTTLTEFVYGKYNARKTLENVGAVLFVTVHFSKVRDALIRMLNDKKTGYIPTSLLAVFDLIRSREVVHLLFLMIRAVLDKSLSYRMDLQKALLSLGKQELIEEDLEALQEIYRLALRHKKSLISAVLDLSLSQPERGWDDMDIVLSQIAQFIEELEPGSVTRKRTLGEWFMGRRPWAKRKIRKGLERLESAERHIEDIRRIDSKVPDLFRFRHDETRTHLYVHSEIPKTIKAISDRLSEILTVAEEEPEFDYFDILSRGDVVSAIVKAKHELSLKLLEIVLKYKFGQIYRYLGSSGDIETFINLIVEYGSKDGIEVLNEAKRFNWASELTFWTRMRVRRIINRAIKKLSA